MPRRKKRPYGQGSVYFRKSDGRWVGRYKSYKPVYGHTAAEAHEKLDALIKSVETEKLTPEIVSEITVAEFLTTWLRTVERAHLKPKAFDRKEQAIRLHVIPYIGNIPATELTSDDVQLMVTKLIDKGYALSTIRQARFAVSAAYKWGLKQRPPKVNQDPTAAVTMPTSQTLPPDEVVFFDQHEAEQLINAAYDTWSNGEPIYRLGAAVELLINTGLRQAEILALEWGDIQSTEGRPYAKICVRHSVVHVRNYTAADGDPHYRYVTQDTAKTKAGRRTIMLNDAARHALYQLDSVTGGIEKSRYVLATRDGTPTRERAFSRMLEAIGKRANLQSGKTCTAHTLRHTYATLYLYGEGPGKRGDVKQLSVRLGHSDVTTTYNVYAHVIREIDSTDGEIIDITAPATDDLASLEAELKAIQPVSADVQKETDKYVAPFAREEAQAEKALRKERQKDAQIH